MKRECLSRVLCRVQGNPLTSNPTADGIYRSTDGGDNWVLIRKTPFYRLSEVKRGTHFAFTDAGVIYAGTYTEGILKSIDGGSTWTSLGALSGVGNGLGNEVMDIRIHPKNNSVLFVATRSGLYKVTDTGAVPALVARLGGGFLPFDADTDGNPNNDNYPRAVAVDFNNPLILYVSNGKSGVYKSTDGGSMFVATSTGLTQLTQSSTAITSAMAMSPANPQKLYISLYGVGGRNIYYSDDGAEHWFQPTVVDSEGYLSDLTENSNQVTYLATPIAPHPFNANIALARGAGTNAVIRTDDGGGTWTYSGNGYTGGAFGGIGWDSYDAGRFILFLIDHGPEMTLDGGGTFKRSNMARGTYGLTTAAGALEPRTTDYARQVVVSAVGGWTQQVLTVSRDGGNSWTAIPVDRDGNSTLDDYDNSIYFHPQDANMIYAGQFKSLDKGLTWFRLSRKVLAVYPGNGGIVYSVQHDTAANRTTVYKSIDGGNTWNAPYGTFSGNYRELWVSPDNQDRIYAAIWGGVNIWTGTGWELKGVANGLLADGFGSLNVYNLAIDPTHAHVVYAGKFAAGQGYSNGVFRSQDYGDHWENITSNLGPELNVWHLEVSPHDGYVYIGSPQGTWKLPPPYAPGGSPVITSTLSAAGTVGTAFSHQITASNTPTSFSAAGLPAGLSVNTGGLISGTPTTIGTSSVTISAANAGGTGTATLALSVYSACDLNRDWATNVVDVQLQVNAALGVTACTSDLTGDGVCNVIDVQRGVNAGLGGSCVLGP